VLHRWLRLVIHLQAAVASSVFVKFTIGAPTRLPHSVHEPS